MEITGTCYHAIFLLITFVCGAGEKIHSFLHVMQALNQLRHIISTKQACQPLETGILPGFGFALGKRPKMNSFCINPITNELICYL